MYNGKSIGPRMKTWGNPVLIGYSCEDFPSRTTLSCLLLRKEEIRPNTRPEILYNLSLQKRPACQTLSKALNVSSTMDRAAPELSKALAILSDTTVRRSAVEKT